MKRPAAVLATSALVGGLIVLAPTTASAATCEDPEHPIASVLTPEVAVGTTKKQTMTFTLEALGGCDVDGASVTVKAPRSTSEVTLHQTRTVNGFVYWEGSAQISPKSLKNSDAGFWSLTYHVTGPVAESRDDRTRVMRASKLSFNAGPEPVEDGTLTYTGTLKRASWNSGTYKPYSGTVRIAAEFDEPDDEHSQLVELKTKKNGTYRFSQFYKGPGDYHANFGGTITTDSKRSRTDRVSTKD